MIDDNSFNGWLANGTGYKANCLKQILKENQPNKRNNKFTSTTYQDIYNFLLKNCFNAKESAYNMKRIIKCNFLEQYSSINDSQLIEKKIPLKNGSKVVFTSPRMVYTEFVQKLHSSFNEKHTPFLLSLFFRYKPYYCVRPTEKEKLRFLCTNCLNPHLPLQSINIYRKSKVLLSHDSLTEYINRLQNGEDFAEANNEKPCKFYSYMRVTESYIRKEGKPVEFTRTGRVSDTKPVKHLVNLIKDGSKKYLKHRTYVDNYSHVLPLMKDAYSGKFIELDVPQNLAIRPKLEVQSANFSNKQYILHCTIAKLFEKRYHYHLSDNTKHDGIFVDQMLRDLIVHCNIENEDLWVQSNNASSQYKNKHSFGLLLPLADEFNLRIIHTYGTAGHGKGAIDVMSSFGVKIIFRKDIVTCDVFFNSLHDMVEYLASKNPQCYYQTVPVESLVLVRRKHGSPIEIPGCMKQDLIIFKPKQTIICKEYLCNCASCFQFDFENLNNEAVYNAAGVDDDGTRCEDENDEEIDQTEHIFEFITVPSFVSLYSGSSIEPLYFFHVTGKAVAEEDMPGPYGHFVQKSEICFQGLYLKLVRSKNAKVKQLSTLPTKIILTPD